VLIDEKDDPLYTAKMSSFSSGSNQV